MESQVEDLKEDLDDARRELDEHKAGGQVSSGASDKENLKASTNVLKNAKIAKKKGWFS